MSVYSKETDEILNHLRFVGSCKTDDATGRAASFQCGAGICFSLNIDGSIKQIVDIRYTTNGCGMMIAAAETIASVTLGTRLTDLHGFSSLEPDISEALGEISSNRSHCVQVAVEAFRAALADHRRKIIEEFQGEKALICTCFGISEETIVNLIEQNIASDVAEIAAACNAGSGCGSCQLLITELIDMYAGNGPAKTML
ncbi:MAG: iron-sulfur cluster assembly scaffold protein [Pyrinomonadaceae bacterium]